MESKVKIAATFLIILLFVPYSQASERQSEHLLIYEVSPIPYPKSNMEYVCIFNPLSRKVNLDGYYITDFEGKIYLKGSIGAHSKVFVAQNATSFFRFFGFYPNFTYSGRFTLSNSGDEVALFKNTTLVDMVIYGKSTYSGPGWVGKTISVSMGHILRRVNNEDTNTAADWTNYHVIGQSDFKSKSFISQVEIFPYPDEWREVLRFVKDTKNELLIESYTLNSPDFQGILIKKLDERIKVRILLDGNPIGGMSIQEKFIVHNISFASYMEKVFRDDDKSVQDIHHYQGEFKNINVNFSYPVELRKKIFRSLNLTATIEPILAPDFSVQAFQKYISEQRDLRIEALYIDGEVWEHLKNKVSHALVENPRKGETVKKFDGDNHHISHLHAKLIIGDSSAFVGSMNFGEFSMKNNREVSILIRSKKAISYFSKIFSYDWKGEYQPKAIASININGNSMNIDMSKSIGNRLTYFVYVDGKMVYQGKNPTISLDLHTGEHILKIKVEDSWGNVDTIKKNIEIKEATFDPRILLLFLLFTLFLYKVWKNHR